MINNALRIKTVGLLALLLLVPAAARAQAPPMLVGVDAVRTEPLQQTVPVIGRVVAREGGVIAARTAGPVSKMEVQVGDRVRAGDVLAVLVSDMIEARIQLQKAELRLAEQELARLERLRTNRSAAFQRSRYDNALRNVAKARANLRVEELALKYTRIRAPFPGVITVRHTDAGAYLKAGDSVVTLMNDENTELEADVPANRVSGLRPGTGVRFRLGDGPRHKAKVRAVVPQENPLTRTRAVRFTPLLTGAVSKPGDRPAIGQSVTLDIPIGRQRDVVTVHKDAILYQGALTVVYVVKDGKAAPRPVQLGEAAGERFVVLRGLRPGELVVIRGNERLQPGQKVRYRKES